MYHIAICDDDLLYAEYIEKLIKENSRLNIAELVFYKFDSGEKFIAATEQDIPYDLLILDMKLGKMDGDETAKRFRQKYPNAVLVFCSGVCLPTVKSFEAEAYRYLIKQTNESKMRTELDVIIKKMISNHSQHRIALTYRNETVFIDQTQILYVSIRKYGSNVVIYDRVDKSTTKLVCSKTITQLYEEVNPKCFAYPHKSYFVNLGYVTKISYGELQLVDGSLLNISKAKYDGFKKALSDYFVYVD